MAAPRWDPPFNRTVFHGPRNNSTSTNPVGAVAAPTPGTHNQLPPPTQGSLSFEPLFPASYRVKDEEGKPVIVTASAERAQDDLSVERLNKIHRWLWLAGRPMPPRPLSYQLSSSREIIINENADMHLVWGVPRRIFLKPIPRYLLDYNFWEKTIVSRGEWEWYKSAFGFLLSYAALVQYESDFLIAKEKHLIPETLTWESWIDLVKQLLRNRDHKKFNMRYDYGELRLSRLNKVYWIHGKFRGYSFPYQTYGEMFTANLAPIGAATVYIALVLTAMQVGLATPQLGGNDTFKRVSYGFTVFSIVAPVGLLLAVVLLLLFFFFYNWAATIGAYLMNEYFDAHGNAVRKDKFDNAINFGDYFLETKQRKVGKNQRAAAPEKDIATLYDLCTRIAQYRSDPDLGLIMKTMPLSQSITTMR